MTRSLKLIIAAAAAAALGGCAVYPDSVYSDPGYGTTATYINNGGYGGYNGYNGYNSYGSAGAVINQPYVVEQPPPVYIYGGGNFYRGGYGYPRAYGGQPYYGPSPVYSGQPDNGARPAPPKTPGFFGSLGLRQLPPQANPPQWQFPTQVAPAPGAQPPRQGRRPGSGRGRAPRSGTDVDNHSNDDRR